jgi:hypothetical protein
MRPSAREGNGTERAGSGGVANGGGGGGARFEAAASSAAVDACTKAQYVDAEPQPSRSVKSPIPPCFAASGSHRNGTWGLFRGGSAQWQAVVASSAQDCLRAWS